jgi:Na+/H+-dicarboxylate symporter
VAIIPDNPVAALVDGDVLAIIFFSIIFGAGILVSGDKGKPIGAAFESAADVMIRVTEFVMQTAPFGVFALMAWVMADQGLAILDNLLLLGLSLYLACLVHIGLTYSAIIGIWLRLPLVRFYRGMADAIAVAFSTSSSSATLPVTIACATDNLGIKRPVASSVLPLGATINMDGTALYQGIIAVFAAQAFGIDLSLGDIFLVMLTATLVSIGTAGIPSVSLFLAFITLEVIGVTGENAVLLIALIFPFDRLLDMMRTATNVTGDAAVATAVAKWEGELDEEIFRRVARV